MNELRLLFLTISMTFSAWCCPVVAADDAASLQVCLVSGSFEYASDASFELLQRYLESNYNIRCTRISAKREEDQSLPGLESLETCDVMVLFTRRLQLTGDDLQRIKHYCRSGKPIVGIRTASHAMQNWLELDKEVFGGDYSGHYGEGPLTSLHAVAEHRDHPVLQGVELWQSAGSLYKNKNIRDDANVLLRGSLDSGENEPVAWTRIHRGGRVFYTSLGHQQDFNEQSFLRMITNAIFWTAGREDVGRKTERHEPAEANRPSTITSH